MWTLSSLSAKALAINGFLELSYLKIIAFNALCLKIKR